MKAKEYAKRINDAESQLELDAALEFMLSGISADMGALIGIRKIGTRSAFKSLWKETLNKLRAVCDRVHWMDYDNVRKGFITMMAESNPGIIYLLDGELNP